MGQAASLAGAIAGPFLGAIIYGSVKLGKEIASGIAVLAVVSLHLRPSDFFVRSY
jgi:hypothetical protein